MSWWKKVINFFKPLPSDELPNPLKEVKKAEPVVKEIVEETELVRARNKKGRYVADDPSTQDINEAYTTVKVKKKKKKRKK
tara:strand:+ start:1650 stop:1892 length:243 start_codon:yes stop_codon:yes gene_type:complete